MQLNFGYCNKLLSSNQRGSGRVAQHHHESEHHASLEVALVKDTKDTYIGSWNGLLFCAKNNRRPSIFVHNCQIWPHNPISSSLDEDDLVFAVLVLAKRHCLDCLPPLVHCELPPVPFLRRFLLGQINKIRDVYLKKLFQTACDNEHFEACQILIGHGVDINGMCYEEQWSYAPVHASFRSKSLEFCQWLIDNGADVNVRDEKGVTPLVYALIHQGIWERAQLLIDNVANVNARDDFGRTPLHYASRYGWVDSAKKLLQNGAAINPRDSNGHSSLYLAIYSGQWDVVNLLFSEGAIWADVALPIDKWYQVFHKAFMNEQTAMVELMLNQLESLTADNFHGTLALFRTACPIQPLGTLSQRANLTTEKTLLHPAYEEGHLGVVQLLLK